MSTIQVTIDEAAIKKLMGDDLNTAMSGAILTYLSPENREKLIQEALKALMAPTSLYSGDKPRSPIIRIFEDACRDVARKIIEEEMSKQDSKLRIEVNKMLLDVMDRTFGNIENRAKLISEMAEKFSSFMTHDTRGY